ncbi:MAG TPA: hypothetical protein VFP55_10455 [Solirubrobacteraceae bacterium]|nr:hypothetical protein [Solirubrobacteraceae bacterium]
MNRRFALRVSGLALILLVLTGAPALARGPARFEVGAYRADVTPSSLTDFYLGGYGIGPMHPATGVLRPIYFRVIAIRGRDGQQVVIGALDSQGYSIAYQNGPFGFRDVEDYIQRRLRIPADHIILQATHTHNGPDEIGIWGGVPNSYFRFVTVQMERAIEQAVAREVPAHLKVGTAEMAGFSRTFGSSTSQTTTGDTADYPIDNQLRVLQATRLGGRHGVIATLVNYSTHPTVYGPLDRISPDWPGATATYLEGDERDMRPGARYGYRGSVAIVTVGAVGHTWPASVPRRYADPRLDPVSPRTDDNYPADIFGNAVARQAIQAVARGHGFLLRSSRIGGTESVVRVLNTNPVLLAAGTEPVNGTPLGSYKVDRAMTPPWADGDIFNSRVTTLRVGNIPFFGVPGEPYPSIKFTLNRQITAPVKFIFGLAQDQLGYVEEPGDYGGAFQCSTTDEWFFTISPVFGSDVVRLSRDNAVALGFPVRGSALPAYNPAEGSQSFNCTESELQGQGLNGLPVG